MKTLDVIILSNFFSCSYEILQDMIFSGGNNFRIKIAIRKFIYTCFEVIEASNEKIYILSDGGCKNKRRNGQIKLLMNGRWS